MRPIQRLHLRKLTLRKLDPDLASLARGREDLDTKSGGDEVDCESDSCNSCVANGCPPDNPSYVAANPCPDPQWSVNYTNCEAVTCTTVRPTRCPCHA